MKLYNMPGNIYHVVCDLHDIDCQLSAREIDNIIEELYGLRDFYITEYYSDSGKTLWPRSAEFPDDTFQYIIVDEEKFCRFMLRFG